MTDNDDMNKTIAAQLAMLRKAYELRGALTPREFSTPFILAGDFLAGEERERARWQKFKELALKLADAHIGDGDELGDVARKIANYHNKKPAFQ